MSSVVDQVTNLAMLEERLIDRIKYMFSQWYTAINEECYSETITKLIISEFVLLKTGISIKRHCNLPMEDFERVVMKIVKAED